jgi:hypothetical protein
MLGIGLVKVEKANCPMNIIGWEAQKNGVREKAIGFITLRRPTFGFN